MQDSLLADVSGEYLKKSEEVDYSIRLPESELEVMLGIWNEKPPVTSAALMKTVGEKNSWKISTVISFLSRLEEKGFVMSYKKGRERFYIPLAEREKYISRITAGFVEKYHGGSFASFMDSYFSTHELTDSDIDSLITWLRKK